MSRTPTQAEATAIVRLEARRGMRIVHRSGDVKLLAHRKAPGDGNGWWCSDGSGIADEVLAGDDWVLLDPDALADLFAPAEPSPEYTYFERNERGQRRMVRVYPWTDEGDQ